MFGIDSSGFDFCVVGLADCIDFITGKSVRLDVIYDRLRISVTDDATRKGLLHDWHSMWLS